MLGEAPASLTLTRMQCTLSHRPLQTFRSVTLSAAKRVIAAIDRNEVGFAGVSAGDASKEPRAEIDTIVKMPGDQGPLSLLMIVGLRKAFLWQARLKSPVSS
jgi:hypothetical protein